MRGLIQRDLLVLFLFSIFSFPRLFAASAPGGHAGMALPTGWLPPTEENIDLIIGTLAQEQKRRFPTLAAFWEKSTIGPTARESGGNPSHLALKRYIIANIREAIRFNSKKYGDISEVLYLKEFQIYIAQKLDTALKDHFAKKRDTFDGFFTVSEASAHVEHFAKASLPPHDIRRILKVHPSRGLEYFFTGDRLYSSMIESHVNPVGAHVGMVSRVMFFFIGDPRYQNLPRTSLETDRTASSHGSLVLQNGLATLGNDKFGVEVTTFTAQSDTGKIYTNGVMSISYKPNKNWTFTLQGWVPAHNANERFIGFMGSYGKTPAYNPDDPWGDKKLREQLSPEQQEYLQESDKRKKSRH